jgi:hypothetical protein
VSEDPAILWRIGLASKELTATDAEDVLSVAAIVENPLKMSCGIGKRYVAEYKHVPRGIAAL